MRILFVAGRCPEPARRGDQVRARAQIERLARRHEVTLVAPGREAGALGSLCRVVLVRRRPLDALRALGWVAAGRAAQVAWFASRSLRDAVEREARPGAFDVVHVQLARVAPVAERRHGIPGLLDLVDALSLNMRRRAEHDRPPASWAAAWEARRLAREEAALCRSWPRLTVVSAEDKAALGDPPSVSVNRNGVDLEAFARPDVVREPATVVFTGNLGYFANVDAVAWLLSTAWPAVRAQVEGARLRLVGARPAAAVQRLARSTPGVELVGEVADLPRELARATVAVAPLRAGSGHPLKVLEAMAARTPLVCSPRAFAGLEARPGAHGLVADTPAAFAEAVVRLLRDPVLRLDLATAAHAHVAAHHTWDHSVRELEALYEELVSPRMRSASRA